MREASLHCVPPASRLFGFHKMSKRKMSNTKLTRLDDEGQVYRSGGVHGSTGPRVHGYIPFPTRHTAVARTQPLEWEQWVVQRLTKPPMLRHHGAQQRTWCTAPRSRPEQRPRTASCLPRHGPAATRHHCGISVVAAGSYSLNEFSQIARRC
jgi:hypothetical protein